jgi:PAS domain S-box-containing protein
MLKRLLTPPIFPGDEEQTRIASLLNEVLLFLFLTPLVLVINAVRIPANRPILATICMILTGSLFTMMYFMRHGYVRVTSRILTAFLLILVTIINILNGGQARPVTIYYPLIIVIGGLLLGGQGAISFAVLSTISLGIVTYGGATGWFIVRTQPPTTGVAVITYGVGFVLIGVVLRLATESINIALNRAHAGERELSERNRELQNLSESLEQRVAERTAQLAEREAFLSGIFRTAGDAIITVDEEQRILSFSQSAERIFGYTLSEVLGQPLDLLLPPQSIRAHHQHVHNFGDSDKAARIMGSRREVYGHRKDGTEFPAEASISKLNLDGKLTFTAFLWDMTERKQLEKALREGEQRFRRIFQVSPVAIVVTTLEEGRLIDANDAYWNLSGHDPKTAIGKTTLELRPGYDASKRQELIDSLVENKSIKDPNYVFVDDADRHHFTMAFFELIDLNGQPVILSMFYDMTEQVEAQNSLRRSEAHVRGLLNAVPDAIFELRRDGVVLQYIPADESSSTESSREFLGKSIYQIMPPTVAEQIMFAVERALESELLHVIEYQLPEAGKARTYEARVAVNGVNTALMIVRDVSLHQWLETERESMIEELERRNAESESLRETTVIVTSTLDISEASQRILQQLRRVIAYDSASVWLYKDNMVHLVGGDGIPSDMPEQDKLFAVSESEPDYPLVTQNLSYILLDDVQENYPQFREPPINYIHGWLGIPLKVHGKLIGIISLDSRNVGRFTHDDAQLALNYANQVSVAVENARLYSDLQNELLERQRLIDKLDSKNAELEQFAYAVSHDLKSPLITIKGFLGFLNEDVDAGNAPRIQTDFQRISGAMGIMQQRLDDLLQLSRVGRLIEKAETIRFNELITEALELVHGRISQSGVMVRISENLPLITGDHQRLLEVIQNLLDNATKFMGDQTNPTIDIDQRGEEDGNPIFFVKDNGMGIPQEHHERIFGIFNKLNSKVDGTGIGLSLVKKIIEVHRGRIWVESEVGKGSTFYFTLPRG